MDKTRTRDPQDHAAAFEATAQRARIEGDGVWLDCLSDLEDWNKAHRDHQDAAAEVVARRLGADWEFLEMREWKSLCTKIEGQEIPSFGVGEPHRNTRFIYAREIIHLRLALFRHVATGAEFSLVPGRKPKRMTFIGDSGPEEIEGSPVAPLLVARCPVTAGQWNDGVSGGKVKRSGLPLAGKDHATVDRWARVNGLRLPTVHEWIHAAKGGATTRFYFGDEVDGSHVWHAGNSGEHPCEACDGQGTGDGIQLVDVAPDRRQPMWCCAVCFGDGLKPADGARHPHSHAPKEHDDAGKWNAFGLVDVIGNVWEWLGDGFARGSAFDISAEHTSVSQDSRRFPASSLESFGFRPVRSIPGLGAE